MIKTETSLPIVVPGDILSTNAESLRTAIFAALRGIETAPRMVELDISKARMIDSVGLNLLVSVIKHVKRFGGTVSLLVADNNVERTFKFTRLDSQAKIVRV